MQDATKEYRCSEAVDLEQTLAMDQRTLGHLLLPMQLEVPSFYDDAREDG